MNSTEDFGEIEDNIPENINVAFLGPGDILHVQLGVNDMGDGLPPWIPTSEELADAKKKWVEAVPSGVTVVVTHLGESIVAVLSTK